MRQVVSKIKPKGGFAHIVHILLTVLLPALIFIFIRIRFIQVAVAVVLLSKWRMFAVQPRHWLANIRANAVDIIVGLSFIVFMTHSNTQLWQLIWALAYGIWLLLLKPLATLFGVSVQAFIGQILGLMALYLGWQEAPLYVLVPASWVVCYASARHFFTSFDEIHTRFLSHLWAYFGCSLAWVLSHWLLFYGDVVAQPTLLMAVLSFGLGAIYYLEKTDRLSKLIRRQLLFIMFAIVIVVLVFSDWNSKVI